MALEHPAYGQVRSVTPTASVLLADNPSQMTLDGTNTWLLRGPGSDDYVVVDPGPKDKKHTADIVAATGGRIALTLITHHHPDHTGGIDHLVEATGTPVRSVDPKYLRGTGTPLTDGEVIEAAGLRITVLATPGHTGDSVSFLLDDAVVTGDTVLGQGTTVLESSGGALAAFLSSLELLLERGAGKALLPAHGPDHSDAEPVVRYYLNHRRERLDQVRAALAELGPDAGALAVVRKVYADVDKRLWPAARSSVRAQLEYLRAEQD
ncbi:MBL fold metallo-hydrolase [Nocardia caishijiensis]|uniref:Glyoxylase-like metal-dependent hydrolase (Beta-lactamase superfamily II) n=1 Tax=Nocardia caishijiensis TaxID=184756 RepID=A0ABQ6YG16_9NOCA|nr:MBL fold metallo-hydrolase [Nocardia caishijiensis]KAF0836696.1 glyoxylase-like metal-dependent hydrolase (beta-lactamase superfamily II) [Nocardia caishijiensis]